MTVLEKLVWSDFNFFWSTPQDVVSYMRANHNDKKIIKKILKRYKKCLTYCAIFVKILLFVFGDLILNRPIR